MEARLYCLHLALERLELAGKQGGKTLSCLTMVCSWNSNFNVPASRTDEVSSLIIACSRLSDSWDGMKIRKGKPLRFFLALFFSIHAFPTISEPGTG